MQYKIYLLPVIYIFTLVSCEKDPFQFETETAVNIEMVIATSEDNLEKTGTGSSEQEYAFLGEGIYKGTRITSVDNRLYRISEVRPHNVPSLSIAGLPEGSSFNSLQLEWGVLSLEGTGYIMQSPVDLLLFESISEDGNYKVALNDELNQLINSLNSNPENSIKVIVSGSSNFSLFNSASLIIPVIVKSATVSPRFELF